MGAHAGVMTIPHCRSVKRLADARLIQFFDDDQARAAIAAGVAAGCAPSAVSLTATAGAEPEFTLAAVPSVLLLPPRPAPPNGLATPQPTGKSLLRPAAVPLPPSAPLCDARHHGARGIVHR